MNGNRSRRPSASLVIACLALFVALGGGAYAAAKLDKNSVTSKQVKNASLKGKDLKDDTVTGKQIKEEKLGQVPSAASSDKSGDSAKLAGVTGIRVQPFTLTNGGSQQILQHGAFTLTATCSINEGGNDYARVLIATTVDNSSFDGSDGEADLDIGTPAADREYADASTTTGNPSFDQESDGAAFAPDGTEILGSDAYAGVNLPADPVGTCRFGGIYYVN